jgi:hypothetical protein
LDEPTHRNESLRFSFRLSIEMLELEEQDAFLRLGILPEDVLISPTMAVTLWQLSETNARKQLRRFNSKALLKAVGNEQYRMHDLLHDEARLRLEEHITLTEAHSSFLERYRMKLKNNQWHTLPDDGYILFHLTWHMEQANRTEEILSLLREETENGRNGWYERCESLGYIDTFNADVARAWQIMKSVSKESSLSTIIGLQCRFALMTASLNNLALNISPELLAALVANELWSEAQALAYIRWTSSPHQQARALTSLAEYLEPPFLYEAFNITKEITEDHSLSQALIGMAPHLPESLLIEALLIVKEIKDELIRSEALIGIAPNLNESLLEKLFDIAINTHSANTRAITLAAIGRNFQESRRLQALEEAFISIKDIKDESSLVVVMRGIAPYLIEPYQTKAWEIASSITNKKISANILVTLFPYLSDRLCEDALKAIKNIRDESGWIQALIDLLPHLPEPYFNELLDFVNRNIERFSQKEIIDLISKIRSDLNSNPSLAEMVERNMDKIQALFRKNEVNERFEALNRGMEKIRELQKKQEENIQAQLAEIAEKEEARRARLAQMEAEEKSFQATLTEIEKKKLEEDRRKQMEIARETRIKVEAEMKEVMTARELEKKRLEAEIEFKKKQAVFEANFVESLKKERIELIEIEILTKAAEMKEEVEKRKFEALGNALISLKAHNHPGSLKPDDIEHLEEQINEHFEQNFEFIKGIEDESERTRLLSSVVAHLNIHNLVKALELSKEISDVSARAKVLTSLLSYLPASLKDKAKLETLTVVSDIKNGKNRSLALARLTNQLNEPLKSYILEEALNEALQIDDWAISMDALEEMAPFLTESLFQRAITTVSKKQSEFFLTYILGKFGPYLSPSLLSDALLLIRKIK